MDKFIMTIIVLILAQYPYAQPFSYRLDYSNNSRFTDVCKIGNSYFVLYAHYDKAVDTFDSALLEFSLSGDLIEEYPFGWNQEVVMNFYQYADDNIDILSTEPSDTCLSSIKITRFHIAASKFEVIANNPMCDGKIQSIQRVDGIENDVFLDEYHTVGNSNQKHIWKVGENFNLIKVFDGIYWGERISVDFSKKGYVRSSIGLYNFYDRNFNYRKQRYSDELHLMYSWGNTPFRNGMMLEYTASTTGSIEGVHLRLIDSNLHIKNTIEVHPPKGYNFGDSYCTFYTGYSITDKNDIWFTGFFNVSHPFFNYAAPYMITKVDSNLNIICQHFVIDENDNQVLGLRGFSSGEVAVFGKSRNRFELQNYQEDAFLAVFGENCESPFTTSVEEESEVISISAYPNPTVNDLTIHVSGRDESLLKVEFFDQSGKTLGIYTNLTSSIQVADYPPGQYFYRIMEQDRVLGVGSWVKQ